MRVARGVVVACLLVAAQNAAQAGLVFNFAPAGGTPAQVIAGFGSAGARWSSQFTDDVTVNVNIAFAALGPGILGSASSTQATYTYTSVRNALVADKKSADDDTATGNLPAAPSVNMLLNRTSNNPNGSGSATPYLDNDGDANNTTIRMSNGDAKALGLLAGNNAATDASITFSSLFTWDFDPLDGITAGAFDFVGVATHEIGHSMGFISGVDVLDINSPPFGGPFADNAFTFVSTLDLYRFSAESLRNGAGTIDWTADQRDKFFSINGGAAPIASFSTGINFGDGSQASHWKDNLGIGIMDPTAAPGELLGISSTDIRALDVIGWDIVPEPGTLALVGFGLAVVARRRRSRPRV